MVRKRKPLTIGNVLFDRSIFNSSLDENYAQRKRINTTIRIKVRRKKKD